MDERLERAGDSRGACRTRVASDVGLCRQEVEESVGHAQCEPSVRRAATGARPPHYHPAAAVGFACRIAKELQKESKGHELDRPVLIAPPRLPGEPCRFLSGSLKGPAGQSKVNLVHLDARDRARQPIVGELRPAAAAARSAGCV